MLIPIPIGGNNMKSEYNETASRDPAKETEAVQAVIAEYCDSCSWSWSHCPNTACVMRIRGGDSASWWQATFSG